MYLITILYDDECNGITCNHPGYYFQYAQRSIRGYKKIQRAPDVTNR